MELHLKVIKPNTGNEDRSRLCVRAAMATLVGCQLTGSHSGVSVLLGLWLSVPMGTHSSPSSSTAFQKQLGSGLEAFISAALFSSHPKLTAFPTMTHWDDDWCSVTSVVGTRPPCAPLGGILTFLTPWWDRLATFFLGVLALSWALQYLMMNL